MKKYLCVTIKKRVRSDELLKKCVSIELINLWCCWKMFLIYSNQLNIKKNVFTIIIWNMIDFINVLKLIDSIKNVFSISKMKLIDFVVLWSNFIELSKRFNVSYCEGVYRGFVLVCKKFDIGECWGFTHFRKHTQLNATKKIKKFAWNIIYLIVAIESFFFII